MFPYYVAGSSDAPPADRLPSTARIQPRPPAGTDASQHPDQVRQPQTDAGLA
ncbi:hypothetical protein CS0771_47010 [Catellatospora sp. IY07-71]|nr:hypothetical protein CS0771_47010 [Catellatospora sp. IY07-71]